MGSEFSLDDGFHGRNKKKRVEKLDRNRVEVVEEYEYASFFSRFIATIVDSFFFVIIIYGLVYVIFGGAIFIPDESGQSPYQILEGTSLITYIIINNILPVIIVIWFWIKYKGTPGKLIMNIQVIDEESGSSLTIGKSILRYIGYLVSTIPLGLGYLWVLFDKKNRAWHDMIAGSVVIKKQK